MAFQHRLLGVALGWKFKHAPGISTADGTLTRWPASLGRQPNDEGLATIVAEYEALPADHEAKDPRAALRKRITAARTLDELKPILLDLMR